MSLTITNWHSFPPVQVLDMAQLPLYVPSFTSAVTRNHWTYFNLTAQQHLAQWITLCLTATLPLASRLLFRILLVLHIFPLAFSAHPKFRCRQGVSACLPSVFLIFFFLIIKKELQVEHNTQNTASAVLALQELKRGTEKSNDDTGVQFPMRQD